MTAAAPPSPASKDESESVTRLSDARWMEQNIAISCSHCRIQFLGTGRGECGFQPKCRFDSLNAFIRLSEVREREREGDAKFDAQHHIYAQQDKIPSLFLNEENYPVLNASPYQSKLLDPMDLYTAACFWFELPFHLEKVLGNVGKLQTIEIHSAHDPWVHVFCIKYHIYIKL